MERICWVRPQAETGSARHWSSAVYEIPEPAGRDGAEILDVPKLDRYFYDYDYPLV